MNSDFIKSYFLVCENVIKDTRTGALSFINARNRFLIESFPSNLTGLFVGAGFLLDDMSKYSEGILTQLKIISPENKIILDLKQNVLFGKDKNYKGCDFVFNIERLLVDEPGIYRIQLIDFPNEIIMAETKIWVDFPPIPQIPKRDKLEIERLLKSKDVVKKVRSSIRCPKCRHEKNFELKLESDPIKQLEQELGFPEDLVYRCEKCGEWRVHLGKILLFMSNKLGEKIRPH